MDRVKLGKAAKLLAKAEATTFEHEATALAERAHRMVSDALAGHDEDRPDRVVVPRGERRRLRDRRAQLDRRVGRRSGRTDAGHDNPADPATNYRLRSGRPSPSSGTAPPGNIDLTA